MATQGDAGQVSRPPTIDDLVALCRELNKYDVKYIIIGGMAMNHHGFTRPTQDIDLLVDPSNENIIKVKQALAFLPDNAAKEISPDDVEKYVVVRVADEIYIDLMKKACDVTYKNAEIEYAQVKGVTISVADISTMMKTKQGIRPRDKEDLKYLTMKKEQELKHQAGQEYTIDEQIKKLDDRKKYLEKFLAGPGGRVIPTKKRTEAELEQIEKSRAELLKKQQKHEQTQKQDIEQSLDDFTPHKGGGRHL